jgi:exo-1,4-beta-D-glucosaminidase
LRRFSGVVAARQYLAISGTAGVMLARSSWRRRSVLLVLAAVSCRAPKETDQSSQPAAARSAAVSSASPLQAAAAFDAGSLRLVLHDNWLLQASVHVPAGGEQLSQPGYPSVDWYPITVPSTVLAGLVKNGVYPDPYAYDNLAKIPSEPFTKPFWYRTEFDLPAEFTEQAAWLRLEGINYRAEVWLNGEQLASEKDVVGTFTSHEWSVGGRLRAGARNALAVRVWPPRPRKDLAIWWQDWGPAAPDQDMGIWQNVSLERSGPVRVTGTHVLSRVDVASLATAELSIKTELVNTTERPAHVNLRAELAGLTETQSVDLAPGERKAVTLDAVDHPGLLLHAPRLWWPVGLGEPNLYDLVLRAEVNGELSGAEHVRFGIRDVKFDLTPDGQRLFRINGKPLFVRGGGWTSDLLLRSSPTRLASELGFVRDLQLNTLRLEGKLETDDFYAETDRYGIVTIAGWMCCDRWQESHAWSPGERAIAAASTASQARRLRNHPSVIDFMIGSDEAPAPAVERELVSELERADWPVAISAAASERTTPLLGKTGVKMTGPYDWVSPAYWYQDREHGGAFGFNTETGPGPALPELDTLRGWLTQAELAALWQKPSAKQFHAGRNEFENLGLFNRALAARYGTPRSLEDYLQKAQLMGYEGERALFEAYSRNKYRPATGVVHWMLNNAWPSLIWHLYAHDLSTSGSYFGARKANEPLHIQYSYDDRSVVVVNHAQRRVADLTAKIEVLDLHGASRFAQEAAVAVEADAVSNVLTIPKLEGLPGAYFVKLSLRQAGESVSESWYWLSLTEERSDFKRSDFYHAPVVKFADFRALSELKPAAVEAKVEKERAGVWRVDLQNTSPEPAFFVRLSLRVDGQPLLPVLWQDNYVSLAPGQKQSLRVEYAGDKPAPAPVLEVSGFNVAAFSVTALAGN